MPTLKQRRQIARATKTFNMKWVNDTIDQVIVELSEYAGREPEIGAAVAVAQSLKELVSAYSQRTIDTPYRSTKLSDDDETWALLNVIAIQLANAYPMVGTAKDTLQQVRDDASQWARDEEIPPTAFDAVETVADSYNDMLATMRDAHEEIKKERDSIKSGSLRGRARRKFFRK